MDKQAINEAERLGYSRLTGSIIPSGMEFALRLDPYPYDFAQAKRLLAEAGYPNGFDAGEITPLPPRAPAAPQRTPSTRSWLEGLPSCSSVATTSRMPTI